MPSATGDSDSDGVCDDIEPCDGDNESGDTDADGLCDDLDFDDDEDGCLDEDGPRPTVASTDEDHDGSPQDCDPCFGTDALGDSNGARSVHGSGVRGGAPVHVLVCPGGARSVYW